MTETEINCEIAIACGWEYIIRRSYRETLAWYRGATQRDYPPNYYTDLNACAEMRRSLNATEQMNFAFRLREMHRSRHHLHIDFDCIDSTAPQQCEVFLKMKGKWRDSEVPKPSTV